MSLMTSRSRLYWRIIIKKYMSRIQKCANNPSKWKSLQPREWSHKQVRLKIINNQKFVQCSISGCVKNVNIVKKRLLTTNFLGCFPAWLSLSNTRSLQNLFLCKLSVAIVLVDAEVETRSPGNITPWKRDPNNWLSLDSVVLACSCCINEYGRMNTGS